MRCVFAGTPEVAVPSLEAIAASRHELVGVVTRPDAAQGRSKRLVPSPVAQRAEELGIPVLKPEHPRDPEFQDALKALEPDCCPVVAYGAMLPQSALDIPEHGWVNLHFSLLPAYRGAAPVQRSVWAGDEISGATTFRIVKAMDAGPIFGHIRRCSNPTCSVLPALVARPFTVQWQRGQPATLLLGWAPGRTEFTLQVTSGGQQEKKVLDYSIFGFPDPAPAAVTPSKFLRVRNRVANCTTGMRIGALRATVDNVATNELTPAAAAAGE